VSDPHDGATDDRHAWFVKQACDVAETGVATDVNGAVAQSDDDDDDDGDDNDDDDDDDERLSCDGRTEHVDDADRPLLVFPHVVGYYEVSCSAPRGHGIAHLRDAVSELATTLIGGNPDIPRRWANVDRSLVARCERSGSVCTLDELKNIASVQGVSDAHELLNMIHFFRAQGRLLYFPQVSTVSVSAVSTSRVRQRR